VPAPLHGLESKVMELVWELGEVNVRTALNELNRRSDKERKSRRA